MNYNRLNLYGNVNI